jgi:hypothetical protein
MQHMKLAMPFKKCAKQWSVDLTNFDELLNLETYLTVFLLLSCYDWFCIIVLFTERSIRTKTSVQFLAYTRFRL